MKTTRHAPFRLHAHARAYLAPESHVRVGNAPSHYIYSNLFKFNFKFVYFKDDECRNIEFKEPVENKAMQNHVIKSKEVPSEGSCRLMCYMEPNCVSINLGPWEGGIHKCELNNATDENQFANSLVNKPASTYLAIEVISNKIISIYQLQRIN